jgi:antitoxin VapB
MKRRSIEMADSGIAKVFRNGRSQAVRLPREFRFAGTEVRVRRVAEGVLLEPVIANPEDWFAELDAHRDGQFMVHGKDRGQPMTPRREIFK